MKRYGNLKLETDMVQTPDGEYIKYEDLLKILQLISDTDPDLTPRTAVIGALIDFTSNDDV